MSNPGPIDSEPADSVPASSDATSQPDGPPSGTIPMPVTQATEPPPLTPVAIESATPTPIPAPPIPAESAPAGPPPGQYPSYAPSAYQPGTYAPGTYAPVGYAPGGYAPTAGYPGYPGYPAPVRPQESSNAVVALVLSITAWVVCPVIPAIVALVFAARADREIRSSAGAITGAGLSTAAKVVSWINIGIFAAVLVMMILFFVIAVALGAVEATLPTNGLGSV